MVTMNKKELAINLSKLNILEEFNVNLEQYQSEGELAGNILWEAFLNNDVKDKIIADLGCGNGIFGIGALLLGAKKVFFIDLDKNAIQITKDNYKRLKLNNGKFINSPISEFNQKVDTVIMNPPFGVQNEHSDREFLEKAFKISKSIYSIHKIESKKFIKKISEKFYFKVIKIYKLDFLIKKTYNFHKSDRYYVKTGCWHLRKE